MKLIDYLGKKRYSQERLTLKKFAKAIDFSPSHITNYLVGRTPVSRKVARAIERVTNGEVTAAEIMKDNPPKKKSIPKC